ncbi:MAG: hypothetical protein ACOYLB_08650 [Phototrophicaceae bacterium]
MSGCNVLPTLPSVTPTPVASPSPIATVSRYPWSDETETLLGICFEAAYDARERVFVLRNASEHIQFYDLADHSRLCRQPVTRHPFEFEDGTRVLAGLWSYGWGCTARHEVVRYGIAEGILEIELQFITEGDCPYELIQPFWVGMRGVSDVRIVVHPPTEP